MKKAIIDFKYSLYTKLLSNQWANPRILSGIKELKIINPKTGDQNYPLLMDNNEVYSLNGKPKSKNEPRLTIIYDKKCPIIDGRIVNDTTFALRLKHFLKNITPGDAMSEEELCYLKCVSEKLLEWQIDTATDPGEINYLERCLN